MLKSDSGPVIAISLRDQRLRFARAGGEVHEYPVSTARNGAGEREGSECTPRGWHRIRAKIGVGCPPGAVFIGRRPTGEIYSDRLAAEQPARDWILTRILWLCGNEPGFNRFGQVDSMRRYIYIHGTPESEPLGEPASHGCIRMSNADVLDLFERVRTGDSVHIRE